VGNGFKGRGASLWSQLPSQRQIAGVTRATSQRQCVHLKTGLFKGRVSTFDVLTTADVAECEAWCRDVRQSGEDALGLDIEWKANMVKNMPSQPVATLQLATRDRCLILQLLYLESSECKELRALMADAKVLKLGVGIKNDFKKLVLDHAFECAGGVDLSKYFKRALKLKLKEEVGLKRLAKFVLGASMDKPFRVATSDWSSKCLDQAQIQYAALDAIIARQVFERIRHAPKLGRELIKVRSRFYLERSFAARKVKTRPVAFRLALFSFALASMCVPFMLLTSGMTGLNQMNLDLLHGLWGAFCIIFLTRAWGVELYKYKHPLLKYTGGPLRAKHLISGCLTGSALVVLFYTIAAVLGGGLVAPLMGISLGKVALDSVIVGAIVGFTEELLFRGLLESELQRDMGSAKASAILALVFATLHLSLPSFVGLVMLSLTLSKSREVLNGSLWFAMGLHGSLVATNIVFGSAMFTHSSSGVWTWLLGQRSQGPLSGVLGMSFVALIYLSLSVLYNNRLKASM